MRALLLLGAAALARGDSPESWAALHAGRLMSALDRDAPAAAAVYEALLPGLDPGSPLQGEAWYWLGRARMDAGDLEGARAAMREAARVPSARAMAREWLALVRLAEQEVESLPHVERFEANTGRLVRSWAAADPEALEVVHEPGLGTGALSWVTDVVEGASDGVVIGLSPRAARVGRVRVRLQAAAFEAWVQVVLTAADGDRVATPAIQVPAGAWREVEVALDDFFPVEGAIEESGDFRRLALVDVTADFARVRGPRRLYVDDLELLP